MSVWVKICGITNVADAELAAEAGADAIGINLVPSSKRFVSQDTALDIIRAVTGRLEIVLVVADQSTAALKNLRARLAVQWLQLHGNEAPALLDELLPEAVKAVRIGSQADAELAERFAGERLLVDAKVTGELGGSGQAFDWSLVVGLAQRRRVILAGGLTPERVQEALLRVKPWGLDVASGVEEAHDPRRKRPDLVRQFVAAARTFS